MNFKNYAKLLLILGLFAAVPARGMSYVRSGIQKVKYGAFCAAVKTGSYGAAAGMLAHDFELMAQAKKDFLTNDALAISLFSVAYSMDQYYDALILFHNISYNACGKCLKFVLDQKRSDNFKKISEKEENFIKDIIRTDSGKNYLINNSEFTLELFYAAIATESHELVFLLFCMTPENINEYLAIVLQELATIISKPSTLLYNLRKYIESKPELGENYYYKKIFNCQSIAHFSMNHEKVAITDAYREYINNPILNRILKEVITLEKQFSDDYYTFIHAQKSAYYFPEKLYTFLWQIKKNRSLNDFLFAHVKDLATPGQELEEKLLRNFLLVMGSDGDESKILYMNYALFANSTAFYDNSAHILTKNKNYGTTNLSVVDAFKPFGYESIYKKFEKEILALAQEFQNKSTYGNLLFVAVPKEKIEKYVYLTQAYGAKVGTFIYNKEERIIPVTSNIKAIAEGLLNWPKSPYCINTDRLEFGLIMTQKKGGLDPDTGIKIIPILSGDPAKLAELQKKEDALFAKIKAAIEAEENAKAQATAVSRANAIVNHLVLPDKDTQGVAPAKTMARINNIMGHIRPQQQMN